MLLGKTALKEKDFSYCLAFSITAFFVSSLALEDFFVSMGISAVCLALAIAAAVFLPKIREKKRIAEIESELPFALLSISTDLELNIAFEKAIFNVGKAGGKIGVEFQKVFLEIKKKGRSVQEALVGFAERNKSPAIKRAVMQLNAFYEQGSEKNFFGRKSAEAVRRLALEMLAKQRAESRAFSGKLVVYSLLFIAVSAIAPALFQSFIIVGSMILDISLTPTQVFLAIALGFPLLDLSVLFYIRAKTPAFLRA